MSKKAFIFPGQGSQYIGMGKSLYENYKIAKDIFDESSGILNFNLKDLIFNGDINELTKTENAQPAILIVSYSIFKVFSNEFEIKPNFLAGHSLGEISALTCSGSIPFHDALRLVRQRGLFMKEAAKSDIGIMKSIICEDKTVVENECESIRDLGEEVVISNYNSSKQIVISGTKKAVEMVADNVKDKVKKIINLEVSAPFHSPIMESASNKFGEELKKYNYKKGIYTVISNTDAKPYDNFQEIKDKLKNQIILPVQWNQSIEYLVKQGVTCFIEMGPKKVLTDMIKKSYPNMLALSCQDSNDMNKLKNILSKDVIKTKIAFISKCIKAAVSTKNSNFNSIEYKKGVTEPYKKIKRIEDTLEKEERRPNESEINEAIIMLKLIFKTKKVPIKEQMEYFNDIFDEISNKERFINIIQE
ncbi:ACP S-malonyltransferase [Lachnotalea glycerini]|uniref:[acyl-carrier-protein] S-malonyltransferase n=1 Tax=Lachnotalea glycerini TaxID=1763509 RepID=A0A371JK14_9FIRM|nr:ACP S-malonyltransferase [Lachnotalea glycerini]RDY33071.1 [acyl-carrier-protein] S-malonyltransferase [Lachnotalea glycerini]